jgi:hypothetical protein
MRAQHILGTGGESGNKLNRRTSTEREGEANESVKLLEKRLTPIIPNSNSWLEQLYLYMRFKEAAARANAEIIGSMGVGVLESPDMTNCPLCPGSCPRSVGPLLA